MKTRVADPALRREVEAAVRRRVRGDDAEDVVQATLADVLQAARVPEEPEEFRRFVFAVARNKVFDHFRRQRRYVSGDGEGEAAAPEPPLSARDILRWAEGELPDSESQSTLEWMLREGDGEKLENIARDAQLPAPRVRKRVSRLRKLLRERWAAELALIGALLVAAGLGALYWYSSRPKDVVKREPPRPLPQQPRELPSSRPAGSAVPVPNLIAPVPSTPPPPSAVPDPLRYDSTSSPAKRPLRPRPTTTDQVKTAPTPPALLRGKAGPVLPSDSSLGIEPDPSNAGTKARKPSASKQNAVRLPESNSIDQKK
jgi:RNA polymerase sigma factor (sigma-70 family)